MKHGLHISDATRVPVADVSVCNGLAKCEHASHRSDAARVPAPDRLIKGIRAVEHGAHRRDATRVPITDEVVEVVRADEQTTHVRDAGRVPRRNVPVGRLGCHGVGQPLGDGHAQRLRFAPDAKGLGIGAARPRTKKHHYRDTPGSHLFHISPIGWEALGGEGQHLKVEPKMCRKCEEKERKSEV